MLLSFSVHNYLSFRAGTGFSMVASRERQHAQRVFQHDATGIKLLPVAALLGGNASGKSNFYRAIKFLRRLVLRPPHGVEEQLPVEPFRLDDGGAEVQPCTLEIEILPSETAYRLKVVVGREGVLEECLEEIRGERRIPIFWRRTTTGGDIEWNVEPLQRRCSSGGDQQFIAFKTRDTLRNQLFLAVLRGKNVPVVDEVTSWFSDQLALMVPDSTLKLLEFNLPTNRGLLDFCNEALRSMGTGVFELHPETVSWDDFPVPEDVKDELRKKVTEGQVTFVRSSDGRRFSVTRRQGELFVARLFTHHRTPQGKLVRFELSSESEGTQRLLDLLPAFFELVQPRRPRVFVIDELDRSLHALLARHLLVTYLTRLDSAVRRQLIFTTHDVTLLDQSLLRRDEVWFVERNENGESVLLPLASIDGIRYDKDIRKAYLAGEFGGVPRFGGVLPDVSQPIEGAAKNKS